jgi:hypothetical protein
LKQSNQHKYFSFQKIFLIFLLSIPFKLFSQSADTIQNSNIEYITDQFESIAEKTDLNLDYSDLADDFLYYSKNKINLNGTEINKLLEMRIIDQVQLNSLRSYIDENGPLFTVFELSSIPGFDETNIQRMLPFVSVSGATQKTGFNFKNAFKYASNQVILRYDQVIEPSAGYALPPDSAIDHPGTVYLGSPVKYYARYALNYRNQFRVGVVLDKDAGEVILKNNLSDTILSEIGSQISNVFDFYSAHAFISDAGVVKKAVVGDYHLEFGQGLTLWSGLAFGKSAQSVEMKRYGSGIRPNTSVNENRFFRGAAVTLGLKEAEFTAFYSRNKVDANTVANNLINEETVSSIQETGLHRTINELLDKNALGIEAFGGRLNYNYRNLQLGATAFQTNLNTQLQKSEDLYKLFRFSGNKLTNYGIDISVNFNRINLFGELSGSANGGIAGIAGMNTYLDERFVFTFLYHNFGKKYWNLYANPFAESSSISNENGIYFGFKALLHEKWNLSGYLDYYQFPWLRYGVDEPSVGNDYLLQLNFTPAYKTSLYVRYRHKLKQENYSEPYDYTPQLADIGSNEIRFFLSYSPFSFLVLSNRLDYVNYKNEFENAEQGYMIYQDVLWRPQKLPVDITFRYAIFSTDSYNSRIYTYESDVLYAFSIPSYFGHGQRVYLMLKYEWKNYLDIWFRIGRTAYDDNQKVGSGTNEIEGNHKTEVKVQVLLKL